MRASSQKCIMQPPILQMQQRTMAAQIFHKARNRYFFFMLPPFRRHFSPSVLVCVQAFISNPPLPQRKIDISLLLQISYQEEKPARAVHPLSLSHTHAHFFPCKQMNGSVCPHRPLSTPPLAGEHHSPAAPSSALTYLDIVGEIGP